MNTPRFLQSRCGALAFASSLLLTSTALPPASASPVVGLETNGLVVVEAEAFSRQEKTNLREWLRMDDDLMAVDASGGAYMQAWPDTRTTHDDPLRRGVNFTNQSGLMAVLSYPIRFETPGRYYVWVRAYSNGSEDNGIHVGLNGTWPESGRKMQWCEGKRTWRWESKQRTQEQHCGVPHGIYLDVPTAGLHTVQFSMREDGFRFDRFLLTQDRDFVRPEDAGPAAHPADFDHLDPEPTVTISGESQTWHPVALNLTGPEAHEQDIAPNPFLHYKFDVEFTHPASGISRRVPGYFAADGNAAETSADHGNIWRAHLSPDQPGTWHYKIHFYVGEESSISQGLSSMRAEPLDPWHGLTGTFEVAPSDKTGRDFRARGRLEYVGDRYLQFAGNGTRFLKMGADAPETLLAYADFDGTIAGKPSVPLKTWSPHFRDADEGDPTWQDGRGRSLLGALNYLAKAGANSISFLTYNAGGDGDNVWPFVSRDDKVHYDVSKLDQWNRVFTHAQTRGIYLHFKLQENELDDERHRNMRYPKSIPTALDGGKLGVERQLYLREMVARFGHHLALNWNLGEENTQSIAEVSAMADYLRATDPYNHLIVIHTFPRQQDLIYTHMLRHGVQLTGASVQTEWNHVHADTLKWIQASAAAGANWVVANDEQGPADFGVPPDPGYEGFDGVASWHNGDYDLHDIRKQTLWGNLMAGGAGVEYYFGYRLPENDLRCEDFRAREQSWHYGRIAIDFFKQQNLPLAEMSSADNLVADSPLPAYAFAKPGDNYVLYSLGGGAITLDLSDDAGTFDVQWFNPRTGDYPETIEHRPITGGDVIQLTSPVSATEDDDWVALLRRNDAIENP